MNNHTQNSHNHLEISVLTSNIFRMSLLTPGRRKPLSLGTANLTPKTTVTPLPTRSVQFSTTRGDGHVNTSSGMSTLHGHDHYQHHVSSDSGTVTPELGHVPRELGGKDATATTINSNTATNNVTGPSAPATRDDHRTVATNQSGVACSRPWGNPGAAGVRPALLRRGSSLVG